MDETIREGFSNVLAEISKVGADAREAASRSKETFAAVGRLESRVGDLEKTVFGGQPPTIPPTVPVVARITEGEGTVADLTGRVLALQNEVAEVKKQNAEQLVVLGTIAKSVGGVINSPLVKKIALLAGTVLLLWLSAMQAKLQGVLP